MVAIIVILAAIAIPQFTKYRKQAAVTALMFDARNCITDVVAQITNATVSGGVIPDNGNYTNVSPNTGECTWSGGDNLNCTCSGNDNTIIAGVNCTTYANGSISCGGI